MSAQLNSSGDFFAVTPGTATLRETTRGIYVGTAGDLEVVNMRGETVVFANVPDGSLLPIRANKVLATNTTADDIVALA
jgi:hypothetical protein